LDFKNYLKTKREEKNLSINKLGELSGVSAMYISQIERGKRETPSPKILGKLAEGLNEPYEDLMQASGYMEVEKILDALDHIYGDIETRELPPANDEEQEEEFDLVSLLDSDHKIFFQDKLLTKEEKTKIKSVIEIVLKD
jgi:HTH-type transcriptional regulator, competence development regulator